MQYPKFNSPTIQKKHKYWIEKLGALEINETETKSTKSTLNSEEVLNAHFLIADFFIKENGKMGEPGPRNYKGDLLQSAISRQFVSFDGIKKWNDKWQTAATLFFGLIKNHSFYDGNKRTALLSILYLMKKQGYAAITDEIHFEELTLKISDDSYKNDSLYKKTLKNHSNHPKDDAVIFYIASKLKQMTEHPPNWTKANKTNSLNLMNSLLLKYADTFRRLADK